MRCDGALEAISAAIDGELIDDDGTVRAALDEHLAGCDDCRDFQSYTVELRARLRFEAVDAVPDVASGVMVALREQVAEEAEVAARSETPGGGGDDAGPGATVTALPLWRRAQSALRPSGRAGRTDGVTRPGRPLAAAVAAALVTGMIVGAAFVGVGHDTTPTAWAEDLPQQVVEAQRDITSLDARIVVTERGRPDHHGERRFTGLLSYEAPERLALELTEDVDRTRADEADADETDAEGDDAVASTGGADADAADDIASGADGWRAGNGAARLQPGEGDVHLLVRDDRWWLETVRSCTVIAGETSCPPGGSRWTLEVTGREPFSDAAPIPLELIGAVDSFTLAAAPPVLGERRIAGREAVGVRVSAAQVAHFLAALSPGGDLRTVHPSDPVDVWLDRDDLVPLAVDVTAGPSDERAAWAVANDFREQAGDTVLSFSIVSIAVNEAVPDAAFEWTGDDADSTVGDDAASTDDVGDQGVVDESLDGIGTTEGGLPPTGDAGSVDGTAGDDGDLGPGIDVTDPVAGAVLPTSTTTSIASGSPADRTDRSSDVGGQADTLIGAQTSTTTTSSTTLPEAPDDPEPPGTTTTSSSSTTLPTTTTTTSPDDGIGDPVEPPPTDDDQDAGSADGSADPPVTEDDGAMGAGSSADNHHDARDEGFRVGEAALVPEPSRLPDGMQDHVSGTIQAGDGPVIGVRSWTDGRAWARVRATDGWEGPRLFGDLGDAVRQVDLGAGGQGYVSADGRKVAVHTGLADVVVGGSLPTEQLVEIAGSLRLVGEPVPADWSESASATLEEARQAHPGLLVPRGLDGFGPPAVGIGDGSASQIYAGPGDRTFTFTRSDSPVLAPAAGDDSFGVEVRGVDGRYSVDRGELEWTEDGAAYSLLSRTVALSELLEIAETLAPLPEVP